MSSTATISDSKIRRMTSMQRDLLIDHIDGELDVHLTNVHLINVRNSLMKIGLLRGATNNTTRPRTTVLTERGRMAVGIILGDYADALVRAGLFEQENPLQVLRRLLESRRAESPPLIPRPGRPGRKLA